MKLSKETRANKRALKERAKDEAELAKKAKKASERKAKEERDEAYSKLNTRAERKDFKEAERDAKYLAKQKAKHDKREALKNRTFGQKFWDRFLKLIIIIGVVIALYVPVRDLVMKLFSQPQAITPEQVQTNLKKPFKVEEIKPVKDADFWTGINWNMPNVIGAIYIPDISTQAMIQRGFTNDAMYTSVGTLTANQVMGKGNYPIAGHNMFVPHVLFSSIDSMKIGDPIYLTDATYVYEYRTKDVLPRAPIESTVISGQRGYNEVTLMSCTDDAYADHFKHRKVSRGAYVQKWLIKDAPSNVVKVFKLKK